MFEITKAKCKGQEGTGAGRPLTLTGTSWGGAGTRRQPAVLTIGFVRGNTRNVLAFR